MLVKFRVIFHTTARFVVYGKSYRKWKLGRNISKYKVRMCKTYVLCMPLVD